MSPLALQASRHQPGSFGPVARGLVMGGSLVCVLVLAASWFAPEAAMRAWLAAAFFWTSVPMAALMLLMMMRLIPGAWDIEMMVATEAACLLLPLAALAFVPVLIGLRSLYPWTGQEHETPFRAAYLSTAFFTGRTVLWFALLFSLTALLIRRRAWSTPVSCLGLAIFALGGTVITTDWLMTLDPDFRSSGFGLYALSVQACIALAGIVIVVLVSLGQRIRSPAILGGLLLTAVLLWAYFSYMQYVVIWSSDFPPLVHWYLERAQGLWGGLLWIFALIHALAAALLILPTVLRRSGILIVLACAILAGKALECAWLVLPAGGRGVDLLACGLFMMAAAGLGAVFGAAWSAALRLRISMRMPKGSGSGRHARAS